MLIDDREVRIRSSLFATLLVAVISSSADPIARAQSDGPSQSASDVETSDEFLEIMRRRATGLSVSTIPDTPKTHELVSTPVFRYSDERRNMLDGTLWRWGTTGRPVALMKVELYPTAGRGTRWVHCLASLSDELIEVKLDPRRTYRTTEPGITMERISDGPEPAEVATRRLLQMKRLARQFNATIWNAEDNSDQMRLLPTPICRYSDPEAGLIDGAVFGFTMGTNPDVLLVIEAHASDESPEWRFGCACMTSAGIEVRFEGRTVFEALFSPQRAGTATEYERWMWYRGILVE